MPPYQPPKRTSHGGVPYPTVWIISLPSCCGRHPVYVLARAVWRSSILPPLVLLSNEKNFIHQLFFTVCVACDTLPKKVTFLSFSCIPKQCTLVLNLLCSSIFFNYHQYDLHLSHLSPYLYISFPDTLP